MSKLRVTEWHVLVMCSDNVDKVHIKNEGKENFFFNFFKNGERENI